MRAVIAIVATLLLISGCAPHAKAPITSASNTEPVVASGTTPVTKVNLPLAGETEIVRRIQVELYQLSVPFGTISRNEKFWKRIDEDEVVIPTVRERLFENGVRIGRAPSREWDYFRHVMEEYPAVTQSNRLLAAERTVVDLPMRKEVTGQDIFFITESNEPVGRTFGPSENFLTLTMEPAPRSPDTVRAVLCPVVRSKRKRLEYTAMNEEVEGPAYVTPEQLYAMNMCVDIRPDEFLVVAPSAMATKKMSIGNSFLVTQGAAEEKETVLLLVPKIVQFKVSAGAPPTPAK